MTSLVKPTHTLPTYMYAVMILAFITLFLPSCTLGPDYEKPKLILADSFNNEKNIKRTDKKLKDIKWWENFNDPILNTLIHRANQQNLDLKIAAKNIQFSQEKINGLIGHLFPTVDVNGALTKTSPSLSMTPNNGSSFTSIKTG